MVALNAGVSDSARSANIRHRKRSEEKDESETESMVYADAALWHADRVRCLVRRHRLTT